MNKYFVIMPSTNNYAEILEFDDHDTMLECVRQHHLMYQRLPRAVYYGLRLEFEPDEIVKSWKAKDWT